MGAAGDGGFCILNGNVHDKIPLDGYSNNSMILFTGVQIFKTPGVTGYEKEPLALSPRSNGTNIRTTPAACSHEVPGLRTFLLQPVTPSCLRRTLTPVNCNNSIKDFEYACKSRFLSKNIGFTLL